MNTNQIFIQADARKSLFARAESLLSKILLFKKNFTNFSAGLFYLEMMKAEKNMWEFGEKENVENLDGFYVSAVRNLSRLMTIYLTLDV